MRVIAKGTLKRFWEDGYADAERPLIEWYALMSKASWSTPQVLKAYMENFDPSFVAFIPTPEQLATVAKDYKVYYKRSEGKTPTSYTMDHQAGTYIYDPEGRLRLYARYGIGPQAMAQDIAALLK